jgi:hypothetical protein
MGLGVELDKDHRSSSPHQGSPAWEGSAPFAQLPRSSHIQPLRLAGRRVENGPNLPYCTEVCGWQPIAAVACQQAEILAVGRPRKQPTYAIISAEVLGAIGENSVLEFDSDPEKPLIDELQCPVADEILIALRKSFSITYPRNPFVEGLAKALKEIRRIGVEALVDLPEVLAELKLAPIPAHSKHDSSGKVYLFKYSLVKRSDLRRSIIYEGKKRSLMRLADPPPADGLIRALREIVSNTFAEMHDENQHEQVLTGIRQKIWDVLPAYNELLMNIDIEPIAIRAANALADDEQESEPIER